MSLPPSTLSPAETLATDFKEFTYIIAHDLGAPVRGMVEFSRLLQEEQPKALNEEGQLYLSLIIESGQKLQDMLAALLIYSRLSTDEPVLSRLKCDQVLQACRAELKDKINACRATLDIAPLPEIKGDAEQIKQLFLVLLDNALTFHAKGKAPHIRVAAETSAEGVVFSVSDNGIGIEPQFHEKIFKVFKRLHADTDYPGLGMGLAVAKKIIERHGGRIWVGEVAGQGTVMKFVLPQE